MKYSVGDLIRISSSPDLEAFAGIYMVIKVYLPYKNDTLRYRIFPNFKFWDSNEFDESSPVGRISEKIS